MLTKASLAALSVGVLAGIALAASPGAAAARPHSVTVHGGPCWHYSSRSQHWVGVCRTYAAHPVYPRSVPVPYDDYYPYHFEPPPATNGPYYGYEPYNGYGSGVGIWF
jgi:hypothetical protein